MRLPRHGLRIFFPRVAPGTSRARVGKVSSKKEKELVHEIGGLRCPEYNSACHGLAGGDADDPMYDNAGVLRTVNVNWNDDGWNVNANSVENPNRWNDGNQVFSRNCWFSPRLKVGEFLLANPSSNHQVVARFPQVFRLSPSMYQLE